jgi:hypothetical protein
VQPYRLVFADDGIGVARRIEFDAANLTHALVFAHREAGPRAAELWHAGRLLCAITPPASGSRAGFIPERTRPQLATA